MQSLCPLAVVFVATLHACIQVISFNKYAEVEQSSARLSLIEIPFTEAGLPFFQLMYE